MAGPFQALLLEGTYSKRNDQLIVLDLTGREQDFWQMVSPFLGEEVQMAAHHLCVPPTPADPSRWINVHGTGHLSLDKETGHLLLTAFDGSVQRFNPDEFDGCYARFLCATTLTAERMRDIVTASGAAESVAGLGRRVEDLKHLLKTVQGDES